MRAIRASRELRAIRASREFESEDKAREMRTTLEVIQEQGEERWLQPMHGDALRLHQCLSGTLRNMTTDLRAYKSKLSREQNIDMLEFALGFLVRRVLGKPFVCTLSVFTKGIADYPKRQVLLKGRVLRIYKRRRF